MALLLGTHCLAAQDPADRALEIGWAKLYAARTVRHGGGRLRATLGPLASVQVGEQLGAPRWREAEEFCDRAQQRAQEIDERNLPEAQPLRAAALELAEQTGFSCGTTKPIGC